MGAHRQEARAAVPKLLKPEEDEASDNPADPAGHSHAWRVGWGLEEPEPGNEALSDALLLDHLGHRITYDEYENQMPWDVVKALIELRAGRYARKASSGGGGFGEILTTPPEG